MRLANSGLHGLLEWFDEHAVACCYSNLAVSEDTFVHSLSTHATSSR